MESEQKNTPAFPPNAGWRDNAADCRGLTKREWFAGQCDVSVYKPLDTFITAHGKEPTIDELAAYIASIRRIEADALISALETKP